MGTPVPEPAGGKVETRSGFTRLLVFGVQGWADSCPIACYVSRAPCSPGPRLLEAWVGATESPGPELLPEYVELAWPAVQAPQSWKCLGGGCSACLLLRLS